MVGHAGLVTSFSAYQPPSFLLFSFLPSHQQAFNERDYAVGTVRGTGDADKTLRAHKLYSLVSEGS